LYSSTRTVLAALEPRIVAGTVIVFDEFWITEHERAAFEDFLLEYDRSCRDECRAAEQLCTIMTN
jgi:hypothetical protein